MKELSLREIQLVETGILKEFISICEKNSFKYYLYYGSLLGAVRHKGFIPWDDDIDIVMLRDDYDRFISYCNVSKDELGPFRLEHYTSDKKYVYPIARLCDSRYIMVYPNTDGAGDGLFIDIYPLDGCGNNREEAEHIVRKALKHQRSIFRAGRSHTEKTTKGIIVDLAVELVFRLHKIIPANFRCRFIDKMVSRRADDKYVNNVVWPDDNYNEIMLRSDFQETEKMKFENLLVDVPQNYDKHLKQSYGDYMKLPSKEEQIPHHSYFAYKLT